MGDRGIPKTFRHMNGYGSHTYLWINEAGEKHWVKYHFHSDQGVEGLTDDEATGIAGEDADFHRRDLYNSIAGGDFPSWTLSIQAMPYEDAKTYRINPFDLTKIWPHSDYPLIKVGTMTLNRNPENFFAQIEQAAFEPSALVPGIGFSPDKMLLGRAFAYSDTHRYRIGPNYLQLPVNRPRVEVNTYTQDGPMAYEHRGDDPVYAPNSFGRGYADEVGEVVDSWEADGAMVRQAYTLRAGRRRLLAGRRPGPRGLERRAARGVREDRRRPPARRAWRATCSSVPSSTGTTSTPSAARRSRHWCASRPTSGRRVRSRARPRTTRRPDRRAEDPRRQLTRSSSTERRARPWQDHAMAEPVRSPTSSVSPTPRRPCRCGPTRRARSSPPSCDGPRGGVRTRRCCTSHGFADYFFQTGIGGLLGRAGL